MAVTIPFGKFRGQSIEDVDTGYLRWLLDPVKHPDFKIQQYLLDAAEEELETRGLPGFTAKKPLFQPNPANEQAAAQIVSLSQQLSQRESEVQSLRKQIDPLKQQLEKAKKHTKKLRSLVMKMRRELEQSKRIIADGRIESYDLPADIQLYE